jgi:hypothetical protein
MSGDFEPRDCRSREHDDGIPVVETSGWSLAVYSA